MPQVALSLATEITEVHVTMTQVEIAEAEIKEQEKQRVLGFVPNFYVSYVSDAAPLTAKQKFELAWKTTIDPVNFALTGVIAGIEQSQDAFEGYGQGAQGYGKRFGRRMPTVPAPLSSAVQFCRHFSNRIPATSTREPAPRSLALSTRWPTPSSAKATTANGSLRIRAILGSLAAGGISNLYYDKE